MDQTNQDPKWIVLKRVVDSEAKFLQEGPYTLEKVLELIQVGEITYSDFIWTDGWSKWERIGDRPEFELKKREETVLPPSNSKFEFPSAEEMLKEILVQSRVDWKEILGQGEEEEEEFELQIDRDERSTERKSSDYENSKSASKNTTSFSEDPTAETGTVATGFMSGRTFRLWALAMVVVLIFGLSMGLLFHKKLRESFLSWYQTVQERGAKEDLQEEDLQEESFKVEERVRPTAQPKEAHAPLVPATLMTVKQIKTRQGRHFLVLRTDAFNGEEIRLIFQAATGKVLKYKSFYGEFRVKSNGGGFVEIDLSPYGLGDGEYVVEARTQRVKDRRTLFVGNRRDGNFDQLLSDFRKEISFYQQQEKTELYGLIRQLETRSVELALNARNYRREKSRAWTDFYLRWRGSSKRIHHENFNLTRKSRYKNYAFPQKWIELRQLRERLLELASKFHATATRIYPEQGADLLKIGEEIRKLVVDVRLGKNHIAHLSGWR